MIHLPNYYKYNGYCCLVAYFPIKTSIQSQSSPETPPHLFTGAGLIRRSHATTTMKLHAPGEKMQVNERMDGMGSDTSNMRLEDFFGL